MQTLKVSKYLNVIFGLHFILDHHSLTSLFLRDFSSTKLDRWCYKGSSATALFPYKSNGFLLGPLQHRLDYIKKQRSILVFSFTLKEQLLIQYQHLKWTAASGCNTSFPFHLSAYNLLLSFSYNNLFTILLQPAGICNTTFWMNFKRLTINSQHSKFSFSPG